MTKATKRTYFILIMAGLLYNIYLVYAACGESNQIIPIETELKVLGITINF
jgi:hypothetical protein